MKLLCIQLLRNLPSSITFPPPIMHLIRRTALRATASSPSISTSFISTPRSITTTTTTTSSFALRTKTQSAISSAVFRRFNSDDARESRSGAVAGAFDAASESARGAAETVGNSAGRFAEEVSETAAGAFGGGRSSYGDRRGGYERAPRSFDRGERSFDRGERSFERRPAAPAVPTNSIYIGNLVFDITQSDLEREFKEFGDIKKAIVATDARGLSKGFGYVEFETVEQASKAIEAKHQTVLDGRRLVVNYQVQSKRVVRENEPSKTLFVGNLAFEMSDSDLNKLFRDIKNVIDVRVAIDRRTGQPRGFAHADFIDIESATKGKEMLAGKEVYGRSLRVDFSGSRTRDPIRE